MNADPVDLQRNYYAATADRYDDWHVHAEHEHNFALMFMISFLEKFSVNSVLDIGSGTGRALLEIKKALPGVKILGIEPSSELRAIGYSKGLTKDELADGDAMNLRFGDGAFDLVCEFGALHHIPNPRKAVAEMLRVSRRAIFISDSNNYGQGNKMQRLLKQSLNAAGLMNIAYKIKTHGKGYEITDDDGLAYFYSVFDDYEQIASKCKKIHMLNTTNAGPNLYDTASHVALLGVKEL